MITLRPNGFLCEAAMSPVCRHSWPLAQMQVCLGEREGMELRAVGLTERSGAGWDSPQASGSFLLKNTLQEGGQCTKAGGDTLTLPPQEKLFTPFYL